MVRHKFDISWKKAEDVLEHGRLLMRNAKDAPEESKTTEEDKQAKKAPVVSASARVSPRTPIPRIRKEPEPIEVPQSHARPPKRASTSDAGPSADRKRQKVQGSELNPEPESASGRGREILPASQFAHKPVPEKPTTKAPAPTKPHKRVRGPDPRTLISARLTATEKRLDELEARLKKTELGLPTRQHVAAELNGAIGELEGNGNVRGATGRLRALQASLLEEGVGTVSAREGWDANDEVFIDDDEQDQLADTPEGDEGVVDGLQGGEKILVDEEQDQLDDTPEGDERLNGTDDNNKPPILQANASIALTAA
ncbi:hypothetical protein K438DRAFT_275894 [Mycena galopus ATCC 62051]|nr:hypothetical protein K438DRAFT_275894 [Mycena galopus ATCC 62051]